MTEPGQTPEQFDAREGDGDPLHDPAAVGEERLHADDGDGGATPHAHEVTEPGT